MTWEEWDAKGEDWRRIYGGIEPVLRYVAARHDATVAPWRWDEPSITLTWQSHGYSRNIRIGIEGDAHRYKLSYSGSAWRDVVAGTGRTREYAYQEDLGETYIGAPDAVDNPGLADELSRGLEESVSAVESLKPAEKVRLGKV